MGKGIFRDFYLSNLGGENRQEVAHHVLVNQVVPKRGASEHLHLLVAISSIQGAICQVNRLIANVIKTDLGKDMCRVE